MLIFYKSLPNFQYTKIFLFLEPIEHIHDIIKFFLTWRIFLFILLCDHSSILKHVYILSHQLESSGEKLVHLFVAPHSSQCIDFAM